MPLTFAYGSNLDPAQIAARCPGARDAGFATLDGHELWFGGPSRLRGGGVLSVRPAASSVRGRLWDLDEAGLASLDRFEGHPHFYRRELLPLVEGGEAWVYRLRQDCFQLRPRVAYLEQVRAAWVALELDPEPVEQAALLGAHAVLFVYGTLRRGFPNAHYLEGAPYLGSAVTEKAWKLGVFGGYPGIVPGGNGIHGELYQVDPPTLAAIDELERHPELYRRQVIRLWDGVPVEAYVYRGG